MGIVILGKDVVAVFIVTTRLPRRRFLAALLLLGVLLALSVAVFSHVAAVSSGKEPLLAATNDARVAYLQSLGWAVVPDPIEMISLRLPDELAEPYASYNQLQRKQGFDLSAYCGENVERYTYTVTNYPEWAGGCQADLYLHTGRIIGGDIVCTGEGGFLAPLAFPYPDASAD